MQTQKTLKVKTFARNNKENQTNNRQCRYLLRQFIKDEIIKLVLHRNKKSDVYKMIIRADTSRSK